MLQLVFVLKGNLRAVFSLFKHWVLLIFADFQAFEVKYVIFIETCSCESDTFLCCSHNTETCLCNFGEQRAQPSPPSVAQILN